MKIHNVTVGPHQDPETGVWTTICFVEHTDETMEELPLYHKDMNTAYRFTNYFKTNFEALEIAFDYEEEGITND
jgi:hypothetical protein